MLFRIVAVAEVGDAPEVVVKIETLVSTPLGRVQVCSFPRADLGCLDCSFLQRQQLGASSCLTTRLFPGYHVTEWTSTLDGWFFPLSRCDSRARVCPFAGENVHWLPSFATRAGLQKRFGSKNHHDCSENLIISCNSPIHPTAARERRLASRSELADSGEMGESPKWGSSLEAELAIRDPCTLPLPSHLLHQLGKSQVIAESTLLSELQSGCPWPSTSKRGISSLPCLWQPAQSPRRGMPQCRGERGKICWADSTKASSSTACNPARDDRRGSRGTRRPQLR